MKLLSVIKNVCVMIGVTLASDVYAMQLVKYEKSAQQFVNQFPSMTFENACRNWGQLSLVDKNKIEFAENKRKKGSPNWIFDIVRCLPHEICTLIALACYDKKCDDCIDKQKFVLTAPIKNIFGDIFILNISFSKLQANIYIKKIKKHCNVDDVTLFKLAEPITILNRHLENNNEILSLEAVPSLEAIISEMADQGKNLAGVKIKLNWYYAYTLANLISAFNEMFYNKYGSSRWYMFCIKALSVCMASSLLSRLVTLNGCHKVIDPKYILDLFRN